MRIIVNDKIKEWVAAYIRTHRKETCISIHVVFSKFNEDFKRTFNIDPQAAVQLLMAEGFLKGSQAKGGFSIWLPEDSGKGNGRPFRSRQKPAEAKPVSVAEKTEQPASPVQTGEVEMKKKLADVEIDHRFAYEQIPHPETGVVDVLGLIKYIMEHATKRLPKDRDMDGGYVVHQPKFVHLFKDVNLPDAVRPDLVHVMMRMGLFKKYTRETWGVLHPKAAEYFVTARSYLAARDAFKEHQERNREISNLRKLVEEFKAARGVSALVTEVSVPVSTTSFEDEAVEALAEAERLGEELARTTARLAEVEAERTLLAQQLSERPHQAEVIKQAFHERLTALKAVRG